MNRVLRWLGVLLYYIGVSKLIRHLNRKVPRVLAYHACEETESAFLEGLNCNTPPHILRTHLEYLAAHYSVISLQDLESGRIPERAVLITFDDGYRSVHQHALPLLRSMRMPAVVYLVGSTLDGLALVWVNELNWILRKRAASRSAAEMLDLSPGSSPAEVITYAQENLSPARTETLIAVLASRHDVDREVLARDSRLYLSLDEIREMREAGIAFGNHTWSHPNLTLLSEPECRVEIERGMRAVASTEATNSQSSRSFASPFGFHVPTFRRVAMETGCTSIMKIGGWNRRLDLTAVARLPVYATTTAQLFAELEVVHPIKTVLRRVLLA